MTRHGPALLALSVLAIAGWTYNINYDTRAALDRISELRARIADERETLQVLRVEWAWLNAPDRLARLVAEHNDRLALAALTPEAFGYVAAAPYPRDLPAEPPPAPQPELLVAAAPQAAFGPAVASGAEEQARILAGVDEAASETAAVEPGGPMLAGVPGGNAEAIDQVLASAAGKAGLVGAGPAAATQPTTMREAVALALIEAGIVQPDAVPATIIPASMPVSAAPGIPVPPARPAVWAQR